MENIYKATYIEVDGEKYMIAYKTKLGFINEVRLFRVPGRKEIPCKLLFSTDFKRWWKYALYRLRYRLFYRPWAKISAINKDNFIAERKVKSMNAVFEKVKKRLIHFWLGLPANCFTYLFILILSIICWAICIIAVTKCVIDIKTSLEIKGLLTCYLPFLGMYF